MRNTFSNTIEPVGEEDLVYPDESSEFLNELEVLEERLKEKQRRRSNRKSKMNFKKRDFQFKGKKHGFRKRGNR
jgi:hypothetical protein